MHHSCALAAQLLYADQSSAGRVQSIMFQDIDCRRAFLSVPRSVNYDSITDDSSSAQSEQLVKYVNGLAETDPIEIAFLG